MAKTNNGFFLKMPTGETVAIPDSWTHEQVLDFIDKYGKSTPTNTPIDTTSNQQSALTPTVTPPSSTATPFSNTSGMPAPFANAEKGKSLWRDLLDVIKVPAQTVEQGFKGMAQAPEALGSATGQIPPTLYHPDTPQQSMQGVIGTLQAGMGLAQLTPSFIVGGAVLTLAEHADPTGGIKALFNLPNEAGALIQPGLSRMFQQRGIPKEEADALSASVVNGGVTIATLMGMKYGGQAIGDIVKKFKLSDAELQADLQDVAGGLHKKFAEARNDLKTANTKTSGLLDQLEEVNRKYGITQKVTDATSTASQPSSATLLPTFKQPSKEQLAAGAKSASTMAVEFGKVMDDAQRVAMAKRREANIAKFNLLKDPATGKLRPGSYKEAAALGHDISMDSEALRASSEANPLPVPKSEEERPTYKPTPEEAEKIKDASLPPDQLVKKKAKQEGKKVPPVPPRVTSTWTSRTFKQIRNGTEDNILVPLKGMIRQHTTEGDNSLLQVQTLLGNADHFMRRQAEPDKIDWLIKVSQGEINPEDMSELALRMGTNANILSEIAHIYRAVLDHQFELEKSAGIQYGFREHYVPGMFKNPDAAMRYLGRLRKIGSEKFFEKHKYFDDLAEALKKKELVTTDPFELLYRRIESGNRAILEHQLTAESLATGLFRKVTKKSVVPEGWSEAPFSEHVAGKNQKIIVPAEAAKTLNNWLSRGLYGRQDAWGTGFRGWMNAKSRTTIAKIGLSAFHGFTTGIEAVNTQFVHGIHEVAHSMRSSDPHQLWTGLKDVAQSPIAVFTHNIKGRDIVYALYHGTDSPLLKPVIEMLHEAGYMPNVSAIERGSMRATGEKFLPEYWNNLRDSWAETLNSTIEGGFRHAPGSAGKIFGNLMESVGYPLMEVHIPRIKTYAAMLRMSDWLENHPDANLAERRAGLGKISDDLDNRFGEMRYKNVFMNRFMKDALTATTLSYGWSFGTLRWGTGAVADLATTTIPKLMREGLGAKDAFTERQITALVEPLTVMTIGALTTYFMTGHAPKEWLDYFYPPNGRTRPDGSEDRISIPGQHKEFWALGNALMSGVQTHGWALGSITGAGEYAASKFSPLLSTSIDLLSNSTYDQREIVSPFGGAFNAIWQPITYAFANTIEPISVSAYRRERQYGASPTKALTAFLGASPAPGYVTRTSMQNKIFRIADVRNRGVKSEETAQAQEFKSHIRDLLRNNQEPEAVSEIQKGLQNGILNPRGLSAFMGHTRIHSDALALMGLPIDDQLSLASEMQPADLAKYWPYFKVEVRQRIIQGGFSKNADKFLSEAGSGKLQLGDTQ